MGLYYGITYSDNRIFVAARNNSDPFEYLDSYGQETGYILVYNYNMELKEIITPKIGLYDLHQIMYFDNKLWVTCSFNNMVAIYNFTSWNEWYPSENIKDRNKDINHFNSFWIYRENLYVLAHNFGKSEVYKFSYPNLLLIEKFKIGNQAHNIWGYKDEIFVCDSANGKVISNKGFCKEIGGFTRGVVIQDKFYFIGTSDIAERKQRHLVNSKIFMFDNNWNQVDVFDIKENGQILDIKIPGIIDISTPLFLGKKIFF